MCTSGSVVGVDNSEAMIELAQTRYPQETFPNLQFLHADACQLPFHNEFTVVFSNATRRLEAEPELVIPGEYALWRTDSLNFSIRKVDEEIGTVRHLGWEDETALTFTTERDINGFIWEHFSAQQQDQEIQNTWPSVK